jgi:hypothetical protein
MYNVKLRVHSGGTPGASDSSITIRVLPRKKPENPRRFLTLTHPDAELDMSQILPESIREKKIDIFQRPVLFRQIDNLLYRAIGGGYTRLTVGAAEKAHTLYTFVSPFASVHARERDFDWYKTQFGTGILGNCGPATVAMAAHWASGIDTPVASIRSEIGMPFSNGAVNFEHMVKPLRRRGIRFAFKPVSSATDIRSNIDRGDIVIALIHTSLIRKTRGDRVKNMVGRYYNDSTGHYIIIKGYTKDRKHFIVYDPIPSDWNANQTRYTDGISMLGKNRHYPADQLMRALRRSEMLVVHHD